MVAARWSDGTKITRQTLSFCHLFGVSMRTRKRLGRPCNLRSGIHFGIRFWCRGQREPTVLSWSLLRGMAHKALDTWRVPRVSLAHSKTTPCDQPLTSGLRGPPQDSGLIHKPCKAHSLLTTAACGPFVVPVEICVVSLCQRMAMVSPKNWLPGDDLNVQPSGNGPDELPGCSTRR